MEARNRSDDRTIGELFYRYCRELEDIKFSKALLLLLSNLVQSIKDTKLKKNILQEMITEAFLSALPSYLRYHLLLSA